MLYSAIEQTGTGDNSERGVEREVMLAMMKKRHSMTMWQDDNMKRESCCKRE